jgi:hypothetical protein
VWISVKETENNVADVCLRRPSGSPIIFDVLLACAKPSRPLLYGPETEAVLAVTSWEFVGNLPIRFMAENEIPITERCCIGSDILKMPNVQNCSRESYRVFHEIGFNGAGK